MSLRCFWNLNPNPFSHVSRGVVYTHWCSWHEHIVIFSNPAHASPFHIMYKFPLPWSRRTRDNMLYHTGSLYRIRPICNVSSVPSVQRQQWLGERTHALGRRPQVCGFHFRSKIPLSSLYFLCINTVLYISTYYLLYLFSTNTIIIILFVSHTFDVHVRVNVEKRVQILKFIWPFRISYIILK